MYYKTKKIINIFIILPILYILAFEIILRIIIFLFTLNSGILVYGINKNINLNLHSIKKKEFYISNNFKVFNKINNKNIKNKKQIWIFGGSTSNSGFCDSKNLSWVDLLELNLNKKNFARNGVSSNLSLNVLKSELQKNDPPKAIIWANKFNEVTFKIRNPTSIDIDGFFYFTNSLKKSVKNKLVTFYFFDEIILRLFDKLKIDIRHKKSSLNKLDYISASENYFNNSKIAIKLAKLYKVENFYIISLFNRMNLHNSETQFYEYYYSKALDLIRLESFVKFINTKKYLKPEHKARFGWNWRNIKEGGGAATIKDLYKEPLALFCDPMHQTYEGKVITAKIISNFINGK